MLELSNVLGEWKEDSQIDNILLDESAMKLSQLHHKYLDYQSTFKKQHRALTRRKSEFPVTERRGNPKFAELEELISQQQDGIDATTEILKGIHQMGFNVSSAIKWRLFLKGSDVL